MQIAKRQIQRLKGYIFTTTPVGVVRALIYTIDRHYSPTDAFRVSYHWGRNGYIIFAYGTPYRETWESKGMKTNEYTSQIITKKV